MKKIIIISGFESEEQLIAELANRLNCPRGQEKMGNRNGVAPENPSPADGLFSWVHNHITQVADNEFAAWDETQAGFLGVFAERNSAVIAVLSSALKSEKEAVEEARKELAGMTCARDRVQAELNGLKQRNSVLSRNNAILSENNHALSDRNAEQAITIETIQAQLELVSKEFTAAKELSKSQKELERRLRNL